MIAQGQWVNCTRHRTNNYSDRRMRWHSGIRKRHEAYNRYTTAEYVCLACLTWKRLYAATRYQYKLAWTDAYVLSNTLITVSAINCIHKQSASNFVLKLLLYNRMLAFCINSWQTSRYSYFIDSNTTRISDVYVRPTLRVHKRKNGDKSYNSELSHIVAPHNRSSV